MIGLPSFGVFLALVVLGFAVSEGFLVGLGMMGALMIGVGWVWNRLSLEDLHYTRQISRDRTFAGESLHLRVSIKNDKHLPLSWVKAMDSIPGDIRIDGANTDATANPDSRKLVHSCAVGWYETVEWNYEALFPRRGHYPVGPAELQSGDLFGLFKSEMLESLVAHVLVYPNKAPIPMNMINLAPKKPVGELRTRSWIFHDSTRFAGIRDYRFGDSVRHVDWKATARAQALKVREFESEVQHSVILALNLDTLGVGWRGYSSVNLENAVSVAASLTETGLDLGYSVGLITNGTSVVEERPMSVPSSRNPKQGSRIYDVLAMVGPYLTGSIQSVIERERTRFPYGSTLVLITADYSESLDNAMRALAKLHYSPVVVYVGDREQLEASTSLPFYDVRKQLDLWNEAVR